MNLLKSNFYEMTAPAAEKANAHGMAVLATTAAWLLAANSGALLLCFNAVLDHKICDWATFRRLTELFAAGAICAFAAPVIAAFSWNHHATSMSLLYSQADKEIDAITGDPDVVRLFEQNPAAAVAEYPKMLKRVFDQPKYRRLRRPNVLGIIVTGLLLFASGLAFTGAIAWVLRASEFEIALCDTPPANAESPPPTATP